MNGLFQLARNHSIDLMAYDGMRLRPYDQWKDAAAFFFNHDDGAHFRVILPAGVFHR